MGSPRLHTETPRMHAGIGSKQIAYGDSPFANGLWMHMAMNIYTVQGVTNLDLHTNHHQRINWLNFVADSSYAVADVIVIPELELEACC